MPARNLEYSAVRDFQVNLTRQVGAKAQVTTFTYDPLDRQRTTVAGGVAATSTYDQAPSGFYNVGRLTTRTNDIETIAFDHARLASLRRDSGAGAAALRPRISGGAFGGVAA